MNPFEQIQAGQIAQKIQKAVDLREFGNDPSTILTKSELDMLSKAEGNDIEKGEKANIGDIHIWNGKKFKKQANGKWVEVSESHGMTKKEHKEKADFHSATSEEWAKQKNWNKADEEVKNLRQHKESASKLSDKEHTDEEVGLKGEHQKGDKIEHNGHTIHVGKDTSGGQNTTTYKAPSASDKTYYDLDKLKEVIDGKGEEKKEEFKIGDKIKLEDGFDKTGKPVIREYTFSKPGIGSRLKDGEFYLTSPGVIGFTASTKWLKENSK